MNEWARKSIRFKFRFRVGSKQVSKQASVIKIRKSCFFCSFRPREKERGREPEPTDLIHPIPSNIPESSCKEKKTPPGKVNWLFGIE